MHEVQRDSMRVFLVFLPMYIVYIFVRRSHISSLFGCIFLLMTKLINRLCLGQMSIRCSFGVEKKVVSNKAYIFSKSITNNIYCNCNADELCFRIANGRVLNFGALYA